MFDSTLELITQAASNSVFIFCFCNLIIVFILVGSKSSSVCDQEGEIPLSVTNNASTDHGRGTNREQILDDNEFSRNANEVPVSQEAPVADNHENGSGDNRDKDDDGHGDSDELRRRVEEFIEKVNKGWRAELSGSARLV